jgi:hypothetical protein
VGVAVVFWWRWKERVLAVILVLVLSPCDKYWMCGSGFKSHVEKRDEKRDVY